MSNAWCTQPEPHAPHTWTVSQPENNCPGRLTRALPPGQHYDNEQLVWSHCPDTTPHNEHEWQEGEARWWCTGAGSGEVLTAIASAGPQASQRIFGRPGRFAGSRPLMYLSAAISGTTDHLERFAALERLAEELGYEPLSPIDIPPWEHEGDCPVGRNGGHDGKAPHTDACYMRGDIYHMLECDAILLDTTWRRSWGARAELQAAAVCGLAIYAVVERGASREAVQL